MTWTIRIPHRSRDESLVDVASHARTLGQDEDRQVCRQLVLQARLDGVATTAGELIDHIAELEPSQRRALLDRARTEAGLATTAEVDADRRASALIRPGTAPQMQRCAIKDCIAVPTNGLGVPIDIDVKRWHCPAHEHLAQPGDMEPHGSGLRYSPSGALVPDDPDDEARERARAESTAAERQARAEEREVDAGAMRARERASREQLERETPRGVPIP